MKILPFIVGTLLCIAMAAGCGDTSSRAGAPTSTASAVPRGWPISAKALYRASVRSGAQQGCADNFGGSSTVSGAAADPSFADSYLGNDQMTSVSVERCAETVVKYNLIYWEADAPYESQSESVSAAGRIGLRNGWDASCLMYSVFVDGVSDDGDTAADCRRRNPYGSGAIGRGKPGADGTYADGSDWVKS